MISRLEQHGKAPASSFVKSFITHHLLRSPSLKSSASAAGGLLFVTASPFCKAD